MAPSVPFLPCCSQRLGFPHTPDCPDKPPGEGWWVEMSSAYHAPSRRTIVVQKWNGCTRSVVR